MTTRDKLTFVHSMARSTRATVRQCEALMRYAGTLRTLAESDAAKPDFTGSTYRLNRTQARIQRKVTELCGEIMASPIKRELSEDDPPVCRFCGLEWLPGHECAEVEDMPCVPVFAGPVLKIRTPGGGEIEVPS